MEPDLQKNLEYERITSLCLQPLVGVMPGFDIVCRDDLAMICSPEYPSSDANQAFLLRTSEQAAEALIEEIIGYFNARKVSPNIFLSPACTPSDLPRRLLRRGFVRSEPDESWMVYEHLQAAKTPKTDPRIVVHQVDESEVGMFAEVMAAAYGMPQEWVPVLTKSLAPSVRQAMFHHYLALVDQEPLATLIVRQYGTYAIVGGAGVLPQYRGSSLIFNLAATVLVRARDDGVDTAILQTTLGPIFERFLRICGFKLAFKRIGYVLE